MSILDVMEKVKGVRAVSDENLTRFLLGEMQGRPNAELRPFYATDERAGNVFLYQSATEEGKGKVLEHVAGKNDESMSCLYEHHPVFADVRTLMATRTELIAGLERMFMALPGTLLIDDPARGHKVSLGECCLQQIMDMLVAKLKAHGY